MATRISRDPIYRRRRFSAETIELCVRWYITYRLSYRDLVAMMAEREIVVSHTTIMRWVLQYVPEYERRWSRFARAPGSSWRMDETAVNVRGGRHYLYRAVDKDSKSVASLLRTDRSMEAAQAFFHSAVAREGTPWPGKIMSTGTRQPTGACDCCGTRIAVGGRCRCGRDDISIMWWSRIIGPSNGDAPRCWGSNPFARRPRLCQELNLRTAFVSGSTCCRLRVMKGRLR
jgi:transposase-like protein